MKIWVDADACPLAIKEILFRAAKRTKLQLTLIANHYMPVPNARNILFIQVHQGFDVADLEIIKKTEKGDLVVTEDIPLAKEAIEKGAIVLNSRGNLLEKSNINMRLSLRNHAEVLRSSGVNTGGPPPFNQKDRQAFAGQLDKILNRYLSQIS